MTKVATAGLTVGGVPYGGSVLAGDLVGWSEGKLVRAVGAAGASVAAVGVADAAHKAGETGSMHLHCEVSGLSNLTVGDTLYLSDSDEGNMQSNEPSGAGVLKQAVGYAVAADRAVVVLQDAGVVL